MERYTIDRIEDGAWAVLEGPDRRTFDIPVAWLPAGAREGDVLRVTAEASVPSTRMLRLELDPEARKERLEEVRRRRENLPRGPKGDISLKAIFLLLAFLLFPSGEPSSRA